MAGGVCCSTDAAAVNASEGWAEKPKLTDNKDFFALVSDFISWWDFQVLNFGHNTCTQNQLKIKSLNKTSPGYDGSDL